MESMFYNRSTILEKLFQWVYFEKYVSNVTDRAKFLEEKSQSHSKNHTLSP
jgi:hypothetical protein